MKEKEKALSDDFVRIQRASSMKANNIIFTNISKLIEQRKEVAIVILRNQDDSVHNSLMNIYECIEDNIKKLLNIE